MYTTPECTARSGQEMCSPSDLFFFSSRRRHTRYIGDWSSDVCSSDLRIAYHDELRAKFPPGVLDLLKVRGLGPKKVKVLWQQLGITDLDTLKSAAEKHLLSRVKGFGEKTEENLLRAIAAVKEGEARTFLVDAARIVDGIVARMQASQAVDRIDAAGSFRRMRETVGDIDILAVAKDRAAAGTAFERLPGVVEVLASGETKVVARVEYHDYE